MVTDTTRGTVTGGCGVRRSGPGWERPRGLLRSVSSIPTTLSTVGTDGVKGKGGSEPTPPRPRSCQTLFPGPGTALPDQSLKPGSVSDPFPIRPTRRRVASKIIETKDLVNSARVGGRPRPSLHPTPTVSITARGSRGPPPLQPVSPGFRVSLLRTCRRATPWDWFNEGEAPRYPRSVP